MADQQARPHQPTVTVPVERPGLIECLMGRVRGLAPPTALTLVIILLWEFLAPLFVPTYILPRPSTIVVDTVQGWSVLLPNLLVTTVEAVLGVALSLAVALPLGLAIAHWRGFERAVYPLVVATQAIPKIAIAPLIVVWFGFGISSKVLVAFLVAFFPLLIDAIAGLKSVKPDLVRLARTMQASEWSIYRRVKFPSALPHIFAGLKTAVTLSVIGSVVAEFMGSNEGLGYVLLVAQGQINTPRIFSSILLLSLLGIVLFYIVQWIEKLMIPWHESQRST